MLLRVPGTAICSQLSPRLISSEPCPARVDIRIMAGEDEYRTRTAYHTSRRRVPYECESRKSKNFLAGDRACVYPLMDTVRYYGNMVDFSFIVSLYVSDLLNVTIVREQVLVRVARRSSSLGTVLWMVLTMTWMPWINFFFAGVRVSSYGYCTVIWWIFPLLFLCTFPIYLM